MGFHCKMTNMGKQGSYFSEQLAEDFKKIEKMNAYEAWT